MTGCRARWLGSRSWVALGLAMTVALSAGWDDAPSVNDRIVEFATAHVGEKVGDGQCTALAVEALKFAGARPFADTEEDGEFVWGEPLKSVKEAKPGDILQFHNAVFKGRGRLPDGRRGHWRYSYPHHTAIVVGSRSKGKVLLILHQNMHLPGQDEDKKQTVQKGSITLTELQPGGRVRAYRPISLNVEERSTAEDTDPEG